MEMLEEQPKTSPITHISDIVITFYSNQQQVQLEEVLTTFATLEYLEESYDNEEEWDTTDSSLFESALLKEEIQDQMNSNVEV